MNKNIIESNHIVSPLIAGFLFCWMLAVIPGQIQAQQAPELSRWRVGVAGGVLMGDIANTSVIYSLSDKPSVHIAGILGYQISPDFMIQAELLYERRIFRSERYITGFRLSDTSSYICWDCTYSYDVSYSSDYITIPVLLSYARSKNKWSLYAQGGVYYSVLLVNNHSGLEAFNLPAIGANPFVAYGYEPGTYRTVYSGKSNNVINTYDGGLMMGLALRRKFSPVIEAGIEARLQIGFAGIYENPQMIVINHKGIVARAVVIQTLKQRR